MDRKGGKDLEIDQAVVRLRVATQAYEEAHHERNLAIVKLAKVGLTHREIAARVVRRDDTQERPVGAADQRRQRR